MLSTTIRKESVIESLRDLPERVSVDEIIERIIVIAKLDEALEQAASGKVYSHDTVMNQAKEWIKR
ncbi:hypothetical protein [Runella slithyformis]|uniref:Uncharacterized protein n=1 Tax=Runella slithyformis (strain ATCC 29530 / DSM 19594 / LMG 11500 / NCIMB 11436 / LSU 4) TaxID=761193 RepID=A0A7U3ZQU3_RUNSL|nr:hypothetical protein [Runella slithyformis]AEI51672.1 hypothetical protein Runsl_5380 [Runella slithyformis DSM 19594]